MHAESRPYYLKRISDEFALRKKRNASYSLNAFSNSLGISNAALSRILDQKRIPSLKTIETISKNIALRTHEKRAFVRSSIEAFNERSVLSLTTPPEVTAIDNIYYDIISEWYHSAILELTFTEGFSSEPYLISKRLGISIDEATLAINRLVKLNLLKEEKIGKSKKLIKSGEKFTTSDKSKTSVFLKKYQRQILEKAIESLENDPIEKRSVTSLVVAADPERIALAKKMIQEFTRNVCDLLESGSQTEVYHLSVALYPVTKSGPE